MPESCAAGAGAPLESAVGEIPDQAEFVAVDIPDPLENAIVSKFTVSRAPKPLTLPVAPTSAVTKAQVRNFNTKQLSQALASESAPRRLKAAQDGKSVFVCIQSSTTIHNGQAMLRSLSLPRSVLLL